MRIILVLFFFLIIPATSYADTVYEMPAPNGGQIPYTVADFNCDIISNPSCRVEQPYVYFYRIPTGVTFDRFQFPTIDGQSSVKLYAYIFDDLDDPFESCIDSSCLSTDTLEFDSGALVGSLKSSTTQEFNLGSSQSIFGDRYLRVIIDPNPPYQTVSLAHTYNSIGYVTDGVYDGRDNIAPTIKLCDGLCDDDVFDGVPLDVPDRPDYNFYDGTYETRFLTGLVGGSKSSVYFETSYYHDVDEFLPSNRPDTILVTVFDSNSNQVASAKNLILPLVTGTSTATTTIDYTFPAGDYSAYVNFFNVNTNSLTFTGTQMYFEFNVNNAGVTAWVLWEVLDARTLSDLETYSCGITDLWGCVVSLAEFLFIPRENFMTNAFNTINAAENPLIAPAVEVYNEVQGLTETGAVSSSTAFAVDIVVPQAGIDVELFSLQTMANPDWIPVDVFRDIAKIALYLMFFSMIISSIWSRLRGGDDPFDTDASGTLASGENASSSGSRGYTF